MTREALALGVGTVLALVALAFVLYPLFVEPGRVRVSAAAAGRESGEERERAVAALREIEFDRETGKLSDADYAQLKAAYTQDAVAAMRAEESAAALAGPALDPAEAAVLTYRQRARECGRCGLRPELDARYCSSCGLFLDGACGRCGAPVVEPGASFCSACGHALAA